MKKIFINLIVTTGIVFLSLSLHAQQVTTAKPPEVKGPVLQTPTENKVAAPAPASDKDLHQTATKQSSFTDPKPVKAKEETQPAKAPERQQQLPQTNTIMPPPNPVKNG